LTRRLGIAADTFKMRKSHPKNNSCASAVPPEYPIRDDPRMVIKPPMVALLTQLVLAIW